MTSWTEPVEQWEHPDAPRRDESDRYAIYAVEPTLYSNQQQKRLCETTLQGVGPGVLLMLQEDEVPLGWRIGVLDRLTRQWLIHPYA